jgi:hypothetical protein
MLSRMSQSLVAQPSPSEESALLAPWAAAFERAFRVAPKFEPLEAPVPGLSRVSVPASVFDPPELAGGTGHFRHMPGMVEHVRRLGFGWEGTGRILTVPTPASFNALFPTLVDEDTGFVLDYVREDRPTLANGPWMLRAMEGRLSIHVSTVEYYATGLGEERRASSPEELEFQLASLFHDLGVHALNYHLVPRRFARLLGERIRAALPDEVGAWGEPSAAVPLLLPYFYDNDLNRYCYAVWCRAAGPEAFAPIFERHFDQVLAALDLRLAQTAAGVGRVASGDSKDMGKPSPVEFTIG